MRASTVYLLIRGVSWLFFYTAFVYHAVYLIETVGLDPLRLVLVGTLVELSVFLFEIPTGVVAEHGAGLRTPQSPPAGGRRRLRGPGPDADRDHAGTGLQPHSGEPARYLGRHGGNLPRRRRRGATVLSTVSQFDAAGQVAGGPMVGSVASYFGLRRGLLTSAGLFVPVLAISPLPTPLLRLARFRFTNSSII